MSQKIITILKNTAPPCRQEKRILEGEEGKKTFEERNSRKNICKYRFLLLLLVDSVQKKLQKQPCDTCIQNGHLFTNYIYYK